ncbi:hypothetical protein JHK85_001675 [Glycine max]|nr:hypothetical protein JHK85_001675 [Glycine max]
MLTLFSVGRKNQSTAWDHFDKLPDPNPLSQAKCRHCGALIKYSSGTTAMCTHLDKCKKKSDIISKRQKLDSSSMTITPSSSSMVDQEACWIALVKFFVALELSFRINVSPDKSHNLVGLKEKGDHGKVMSYINGLCRSCIPIQLINWVTNQNCIGRKIS